MSVDWIKIMDDFDKVWSEEYHKNKDNSEIDVIQWDALSKIISMIDKESITGSKQVILEHWLLPQIVMRSPNPSEMRSSLDKLLELLPFGRRILVIKSLTGFAKSEKGFLKKYKEDKKDFGHEFAKYSLKRGNNGKAAYDYLKVKLVQTEKAFDEYIDEPREALSKKDKIEKSKIVVANNDLYSEIETMGMNRQTELNDKRNKK